ncbi:DUF6221 family protein [Streptomyces sp. NPDC005576]|uniref:DUF6221 family protein n=1 Tax=Streptomyces sp. NPDC005576 TaxID=3364726 RepID=UPI0036CD6E96
MTDDLVQFLRDRLDEDEAVARGVTVPLDWHQGPGDDDPEWTSDEMVCMWPPEFHTPYEQDKHWRGLTADPAGLAAHIARHDPARILREVEAKRQMIETFESRYKAAKASNTSTTLGLEWVVRADVLRLLALPYADHPDYQQEWRP